MSNILRRLVSVRHFQSLDVPLQSKCSPGPFLVIARHLATAASDEELIELFQPPPPQAPTHTSKKAAQQQRKDAIITCARPEFNHYKNQTYNKLKPIPLASKGWFNRKSKGDSFTIQINEEPDYLEKMFWGGNVTKTFEELGLQENIISALKNVNIHRPTRIQCDAISEILSGKNTLISAETGCGKTLAFLLPLISQILKWKWNMKEERNFNTPLGLIITPSRELALQIGKVASELSHHLPFSCTTLVGGKTKRQMLDPQLRNVDLQIASLGALSKLTTTGVIDISQIRHIVLDEADTLLDDSFNDLLIRFLRKFRIVYKSNPKAPLPDGTQLTLVAATLPRSVFDILRDIVEPDSLSKVTSDRLHRVLPHVPQTFHRLGRAQKPPKLLHIVKQALQKKLPVMIFSNKTPTCDWVTLMLHENGIESVNLNGDMPHVLRNGQFDTFRSGDVNILSCTDIASRGLDTLNVRVIVNYDFPLYIADYIHRCGRVGRVGSHTDCHIHNFVSGEREIELVNKIELSVRLREALPNVNANITRIIHNQVMSSPSNPHHRMK